MLRCFSDYSRFKTLLKVIKAQQIGNISLLHAESLQFELEFVLVKQEAVNAVIQSVEARRFTRLSWSLRSSSSAPERLTSAEIDIADLA